MITAHYSAQVLIYGVQAQPKPSSYQVDEESTPRPVNSNEHTSDIAQKENGFHKHQGGTGNNYKVPGGFEDDEDDEDGNDGVVISPSSGGKTPTSELDGDTQDDYEDSSKTERTSTPSFGQRTISIRNLPDRVTHEDIVDAVRGGALLHVYVRPWDRFADISFVDESAAYEFQRYTKLHGLYVAGKRVSELNMKSTWNVLMSA